MKKTKSRARPGGSGSASVDRWTVERLDRDADMARIESVPMKADAVTPALLGSLDEQGPLEGMDDLSLWEPRRRKMKSMTLRTLVGKLKLRKNEEEKLSENMVFWVVRRGGKDKAEKVYHATPAARRISKDLYRKVTRTEGEEK